MSQHVSYVVQQPTRKAFHNSKSPVQLQSQIIKPERFAKGATKAARASQALKNSGRLSRKSMAAVARGIGVQGRKVPDEKVQVSIGEKL